MAKLTNTHNLAVVKPGIAKEWHPTKNGKMTPRDVTSFSSKKVWWRCSKGHEWQATVYNRSNGSGCPYCSGFRTCKDNCLKTVNPELAREWHPSRNGELTPKDVTPYSNKKVWWICNKGHEWQTAIYVRTGHSVKCPYCSGKKLCSDNFLGTVNPELARQWHPIKNGKLTPQDVTGKSYKKVWWLCSKGHEWQTTIYARNKRGYGCPYCSGMFAHEGNNLQLFKPKLSEEWHPTKNGKLTPKDVTPYSAKKVWWRCSKGHEWQAAVYNRSRERGCPYCRGFKVCRDNCLKTVNPSLAREWHPSRNGKLTPKDVTAGSSKKVWWECKKGHVWQAIVNHRSRGFGCPKCKRLYPS
jgi:hypothetical protein